MKNIIYNIIAKMIVKICTFILFAILLCGLLSFLWGCKPQERIIVQDSIKTEIRTEYKTDTFYYALPSVHDAIMTKDSTSTLENDYAMSYAAIVDGSLYHTLDIKPVNIPVEIKTKIQYIDRKRTQYRDITVTKEKCSSWLVNTAIIEGCIIAVFVFLFWLIIKVRNKQ